MTTVSCNHPDFAAEVDVVRIHCVGCGEDFAFVGIEPGLSSDGPRVSVSQLEAHLPIRPASARLGSGARYGFTVRAIG